MKKIAHLGIVLCLAAGAFAQRLPDNVIPTHYQIKLEPILANEVFNGEEIIDVQVLHAARSIILNAAEISFGKVEIRSGDSTQTAEVTTDPKNQTASLTVSRALKAAPARIHIQFTGILNNKLRGFYLAKTSRRKYATTQMEATDARRAFPCFDEPQLKAIFDITAVVDHGDTAISNGKIESDVPGPGDKHTIRFATTPKMSTYLVALAVGDFECLEGEADGIPIRVCAVPERKDLGQFALESAEHSVKFYDEYFGIKYPYGKLDLVALPDFEAGAMENTGAIFYRESALLIDEKSATIRSHKSVAAITAHEIAHQWFGDLVTMRWWDDVWLNEGFATWMSSKPLMAWKPEWNIGIDNARSTAGSLSGDAIQATRAIHAAQAEAETPAQIDALFDGIAYGKTAAVLRMLESYLGPESFRKGVQTYLKKYSYANASAADFWKTMTEATKKPVDSIMPTFVNQPGAPMLTIEESCEGKPHLELSQTRFFLDPKVLAGASPEVWQLPVCWKMASTAKGDAQCHIISHKQESVMLPRCEPWVYVNANAHGYYRSAYSSSMLKHLSENLQALSPGERIMLLSDEWDVARSGRHPIGEYLSLAEAFHGDNTRQVVETIADTMQYIGQRLVNDANRQEYRAFVRKLFLPRFQELGWRTKPNDSEDNRELRSSLLKVLGDTGRDPEILAQARQKAEEYMRDPQSVDPDIAGVVLQLAALNSNETVYNDYLAHEESANSPQDYYRYFSALPYFREPGLAERTLSGTLSDKVRNQDMLSTLNAEMGAPETREQAWEYIKSHWSEIEKKAPESGGRNLAGATGSFCDAKAKQDVQQFFAERSVENGSRQLRQAIESMNTCIAFSAAQASNLDSWLKQRGKSPADN